jgi:glycosyltransferase involved in cell wall biosynthesis
MFKVSCIIPVKIGDDPGPLLNSIKKATRSLDGQIQPMIVFNTPCFGRVQAKNFGASQTHAKILVFVDADCQISESFFEEVIEKSKNPYFVGGGVKRVRLTRYSSGIIAGLILLGFYLLFKQITLGAFWVRREVFDSIGGFYETKWDDIDFALRLKKYAQSHHQKFESLKRSTLLWNTRKFDEYGDWHWLKGYKS